MDSEERKEFQYPAHELDLDAVTEQKLQEYKEQLEATLEGLF